MEVSASRLSIQGRTGSLQWPWTARKAEGPNKGTASSDAELAERLRQRDEQAFLCLYDLHRSSVFRFLMHMTGSITTAEELTQEVFIVILDAMCTGTAGQFDAKRGTWEGYLLGIARNLARAEKRRASRAVSLDNIVETPEWERILNAMFRDNQPRDLAALIAARSELRALHSAILGLPEHYREAVVLCSLQEKSYRDASRILQCSEGTVASRMNRAKVILAAKLRRAAPNTRYESTILEGKEGADVEIETN